jgi:predicted aspartyl protease
MRIYLQLVSERLRWFTLLLVASFLAGPTGAESCLAGDKQDGGSLEDYLRRLGYEAVDFERTDKVQPFVDGVLNGRKRKFLVDTGWGVTTLNESTARGLKRTDQLDAVLLDTVLGTVTNSGFVLMDKLVLGRAQFLNQPARIQKLRSDYIRVPFDGVVGYDFLLRNFCLIDCWKGRLYVRGAKSSDEESKVMEETLRVSGFAEAPLTSKYMLSVESQINGQSVRLGVDTGAPYDELDDSELTPLGLTVIKYDRAATGTLIQSDVTSDVIGLGDIGSHKLRVARLETFQIGPRKWKNLDFGVTDLKAWDLAKPGTHGEAVKGLLSQSGLARSGALIDVSGRKLWLRPQKPPSY